MNFCQRTVLKLVAILSVWVALSSSALAQFEIRVNGPTSINPGQQQTYRVSFRTISNVSNLQFGVRITPINAMSNFRAQVNKGSLVSGGNSGVTYALPFLARFDRIGMLAIVTPNSNFRGSFNLEFFAKIAGSTTDISTEIFAVSCGQLPAPALKIPLDDEILSPSPVFRVNTTTTIAVPVTYEIEVSGPDGQTISSSSMTSGTDFTHFMPLDDGFLPGNYSWRARALDENGAPGVWSAPRTFISFGGFDMAGAGSQTFFNNMYAAGWQTFFAASWGGYSKWAPAAVNMIRAHNAGCKVAAYCFMNFDNGSTIPGAPANQTGDWQVDQALANIGYVNNKSSLPYDLKYLMIDIENRFQGTMSTDDRVQRIAEGVQRVRNLGFWPMIYTRNEGFNQWWNQYTGSSEDFQEMPLWGSKPELATAVFKDHLSLDVGNPWVRFGGWEVRGGKQYLLDLTLFGGRVDLNVWDPVIWNVTSPPPGSINVFASSHTIVRQTDGTYRVNITLGNSGSVEAYAVRVGELSLGGSSLSGRHRIGRILSSGSRAKALVFPASAGSPGSTVVLSYNIWTGHGPQPMSVNLTLP